MVTTSVKSPAGSQQSGCLTAQVAASAAVRVDRRSAGRTPTTSFLPDAAGTGAMDPQSDQAAGSRLSPRASSRRSNNSARPQNTPIMEHQDVPAHQQMQLQGRLVRAPGITARAATAVRESIVQGSGMRQGNAGTLNKAGVKRWVIPMVSQPQQTSPTAAAAAAAAAAIGPTSPSSAVLDRSRSSKSRGGVSAQTPLDGPACVSPKPSGLKSAMKARADGSSSEDSHKRVTFQAKNKMMVHVYHTTTTNTT